MRDAGFLRRLSDPARDFIDDDIVMGGVAAQEAANADDGVVFVGLSERARSLGNLKAPWDANYVDIFFLCSRTE